MLKSANKKKLMKKLSIQLKDWISVNLCRWTLKLKEFSRFMIYLLFQIILERLMVVIILLRVRMLKMADGIALTMAASAQTTETYALVPLICCFTDVEMMLT